MAAFVAGIVATVLFSSVGLEAVRRLRRGISWRQFTRALEHEIAELEAGDWKPDVIIGLNSGVVPASVIALNLRVQSLMFYDCLPRYVKGQRVANEISPRPVDLGGQNILVIDDQAYTGRSLETLYKHLVTEANADPSRVKRMALFTHSSGAGPIELDFPPFARVSGRVKRMPWVISPGIRPFWEERTND
jgi:hypoxanthine phosphoribosyltransferase